MNTTNNYLETSLIFLLGLFLFTFGLGSQEIIGFESRFYLFALEMWRHGPTWFPLTYQEPYPDYPATSTFLIYIVSHLFHGLDKFSAAFPSALAAAVALATTYAIGALHAKRWGLAGVLFLLFTAEFLIEARTISLDQYVTAVTTLSFYIVYHNQVRPKKISLNWIFLLLGLGFLFRGPIGLIVPAGVVSITLFMEKDFSKLLYFASIALLLLITCSLVLLGLAYQTSGADFMHDVLQKEVFGRMQNVTNPPFYFYFLNSFGSYAISYPLAWLVLLGMTTGIKNQLIKKLIGWVLVIMIGLSIPGDKKIRYILPMAPALALISGYLFVAASQKRYFLYLRKITVALCFIFPIAALFLLLVVHHRLPNLDFYFYPAVVFFILMQLSSILFRKHALRILMLAVISFIAFYIYAVEPLNIDINKTREFVQTVEALREKENAKLAFYQENKDGWVIKYLINMKKEDRPLFINQAQELDQMREPTFIITLKENFTQMEHGATSYKVRLEGRIGRKKVVVFTVVDKPLT